MFAVVSIGVFVCVFIFFVKDFVSFIKSIYHD